MAKKQKMDGEAPRGIAEADLKRVVAEIGRQKKLASEYAGNAGKATQNACEQYGLEKTALTFARRLADMEDGKRQAVIRATIDYWNKLGFFDQIDAFDDLLATFETIVGRAHNVKDGVRRDEDGNVVRGMFSA
jgi:hypothetical protein